jgi:hypothetical protein
MGNKSMKKAKNFLSMFSKEDLPSYQDTDDYQDDEKIEVVVNNDGGSNTNLDLNSMVTASLKLSKPFQKETADKTVLPMLLSIDIAELKKKSKTKASIDLICVLDKSGSMEGDKIRLLIDSFNNIMEFLGENDRMSVIIFESHARRLTPLLKMNDKGKAITLNALKSVSADGGTSIASGLKKALQVIKQRRIANSVTSVLILSDGLDSGATTGCKTLLQDNPDIGTFTMNTFGYGNDHDPQLMSGLAQLRDGSFYFIDKLDTVDEVFVDCLGGLVSVVAKDLKISVKTNNKDEFLPGINFIKAFGVAGFWKLNSNTNTYNAELMQMITGKNYSYVFEVEIPKLVDPDIPARSFLVGEAELTFKDLIGESYKKTCQCDITFVEEESKEVERQVLIEYYRVKTAEVTERANSMSSRNDFDGAKKVLQDFKLEMQVSSVSNEQVIKNLIKDLEASIVNVKPEVYHVKGKHELCENYVANMNKKSNFKSNNQYMNSCQDEMVQQCKAMKFK